MTLVCWILSLPWYHSKTGPAGSWLQQATHNTRIINSKICDSGLHISTLCINCFSLSYTHHIKLAMTNVGQ